MTRTDAGGSREEAMGNIPDHEAVAHTNMCDAHGGDACDCGATEIARLRAELQREREARETAEAAWRDGWRERAELDQANVAIEARAEAAEAALQREREAREEAEKERDRWHRDAVERVAAFSERSAALRRAEAAEQRLREVEGERDELRAESRRWYVLRYDGEVVAQDVDPSEVVRRRREAAKQIPALISARDAALSDRAALLELLRRIDAEVLADAEEEGGTGMCRAAMELRPLVAAALAPSRGKEGTTP